MKKTKGEEVPELPIDAEVGNIEEQIEITIKQTFFIDEEEGDETWFDKRDEETEDESIDVYFIDDDKSW